MGIMPRNSRAQKTPETEDVHRTKNTRTPISRALPAAASAPLCTAAPQKTTFVSPRTSTALVTSIPARSFPYSIENQEKTALPTAGTNGSTCNNGTPSPSTSDQGVEITACSAPSYPLPRLTPNNTDVASDAAPDAIGTVDKVTKPPCGRKPATGSGSPKTRAKRVHNQIVPVSTVSINAANLVLDAMKTVGALITKIQNWYRQTTPS